MSDDGWTVVSRHKGRKKNKDSGGTVVAGAAAAIAAEQAANKKPQHLDDFYRFQSREKRRDGGCPMRYNHQHRTSSCHSSHLVAPSLMCLRLFATELLELRKKFQQDKRRIAELRAQRRFRPY
jgi:hypothetical protein